MDSGVWCLYRGRKDGEGWSTAEATYGQLAEWSDLPSFVHYMGTMPFPFDIESAVRHYESAKSDAAESGLAFDHHYYANGFLESVYELWQTHINEDTGAQSPS